MSWATCSNGHAHWGRRGAAGLLVAQGGRALLQLRAGWSHQGGTWSIPGGAIERGETSVQAALREAEEELGSPATRSRSAGSYVATLRRLDLRDGPGRAAAALWSSPTSPRATTTAGSAASHVDDLPLHPAFRTAWTEDASGLRAFVDAA